jgi:hypothetical protein
MIGSILLPLGLPREQFFQHLHRPADPQHRFVQVRTLHLYFLKLGLTRFEFLLQLLKPSLYFLPHGFDPLEDRVWVV